MVDDQLASSQCALFVRLSVWFFYLLSALTGRHWDRLQGDPFASIDANFALVLNEL